MTDWQGAERPPESRRELRRIAQAGGLRPRLRAQTRCRGLRFRNDNKAERPIIAQSDFRFHDIAIVAFLYAHDRRHATLIFLELRESWPWSPVARP